MGGQACAFVGMRILTSIVCLRLRCILFEYSWRRYLEDLAFFQTLDISQDSLLHTRRRAIDDTWQRIVIASHDTADKGYWRQYLSFQPSRLDLQIFKILENFNVDKKILSVAALSRYLKKGVYLSYRIEDFSLFANPVDGQERKKEMSHFVTLQPLSVNQRLLFNICMLQLQSMRDICVRLPFFVTCFIESSTNCVKMGDLSEDHSFWIE